VFPHRHWRSFVVLWRTEGCRFLGSSLLRQGDEHCRRPLSTPILLHPLSSSIPLLPSPFDSHWDSEESIHSSASHCSNTSFSHSNRACTFVRKTLRRIAESSVPWSSNTLTASLASKSTSSQELAFLPCACSNLVRCFEQRFWQVRERNYLNAFIVFFCMTSW